MDEERTGAVIGRRILLGVTVDSSWALLDGFPELLVDQGWEVHLVSSRGENLERYLDLPGVTVHGIDMWRHPAPKRDLRALASWISVLRRIKPDVMSVGTPKASLLGLIAGFLVRVPVRQYMVRGLRLEGSRGAKLAVLWAAEKATMVASTDAVAISPSLREALVKHRIARDGQVSVIGAGSSNGIDLERYNPNLYGDEDVAALMTTHGVDDKLPVVGFVGRLAVDKGVLDITDAMQAMKEEGLLAQLLVVGAREGDEVQGALNACTSAGIPVIMTGVVENPAPYYALMDVFCMPSRREGFGNAAAEASAMGIPVVATTSTGLVDAVKHGETGLLSAIGDVNALTSNLLRLLRDTELRERLGSAGRRRTRNLFERSAVQDGYAQRLDELVRSVQ